MQIIPILHNIRSTYNVGAILRTAEGFGVKEVIFSGYTPFPGEKPGTLPHITEKITRGIQKTALGAEKLVKCTYCPDILRLLQEITTPTPGSNHKNLTKPAKTALKMAPKAPIIALENNIHDPRLIQLSEVKAALNRLQTAPNPSKNAQAYLLLGEEVTGINPELYPFITIFAEIPMQGQKESFNVSVAAGIALYELTKPQ